MLKPGQTRTPTPEQLEAAYGPDGIAARIRAVAKDCGYAIGVHGTVARDLDLIAAPWAPEAVSAQDLVDTICSEVGLGISETAPFVEPEAKAWGRLAWSLYGCAAFLYIDLSVAPRAGEAVPPFHWNDYLRPVSSSPRGERA